MKDVAEIVIELTISYGVPTVVSGKFPMSLYSVFESFVLALIYRKIFSKTDQLGTYALHPVSGEGDSAPNELKSSHLYTIIHHYRFVILGYIRT